jgi:hypothetical protein
MRKQHRATLARPEDNSSAAAVHAKPALSAGPAGIDHVDSDPVEEDEPLEIPDLSFEFESLLSSGPNIWNAPPCLDKRGMCLYLPFAINKIY